MGHLHPHSELLERRSDASVGEAIGCSSRSSEFSLDGSYDEAGIPFVGTHDCCHEACSGTGSILAVVTTHDRARDLR